VNSSAPTAGETTTVFATTKLIFVVLGAAVATLACVIAGTFVARARLLDASAWVRHSSDVELALATCRVHGLKLVNDALGHEAGDQMIRSGADVLRRTFRESDIIARLGGDEFVALLVNADPSMHGAVLERLRVSLEERNAVELPGPPLSLSVGITFFDPDHPLSLPELVLDADRLMYVNKREQRRLVSELPLPS
jgi:diguanylate cyclase (GGDEF)-like protein